MVVLLSVVRRVVFGLFAHVTNVSFLHPAGLPVRMRGPVCLMWIEGHWVSHQFRMASR